MKQLNKYYTLDEALTQVGKGWAPLIHHVYNAREALGTPVGIIQVKEKFGGLRIYTEYYHEELEKVIIDVGRQSFTVCEVCGNNGELCKSPTGWYRTLCGAHMNEYEPIGE
jgi:hypothetical protein